MPVYDNYRRILMRLWHYDLLPYLPKSQLIAQWRELNAIYKNQPKHILINYVYEYDKVHLLAYSLLLLSELSDYDLNMDNFNEYFKDTKMIGYYNIRLFPNHHNKRYFRQCFFNLQEKYDRGQKDFTPDIYKKLLDHYKFIINP